jgi:SAM-dependent methyltransferase
MRLFFSAIKKVLLDFILFFLPKEKKEIFKKKIFYGTQKFCPICKSHLKKFYTLYFPKDINLKPRPEAVCPVCGSIERIRLLWFYLEKYTDLFREPVKKLLHIAPEAALEERFKKNHHIDYLSADIDPTRAMAEMDITDIDMPENIFDVIICSHVLEHIPEHKKALKELYRVLKPDGWAIIQVPIIAESTFEDPQVKDPSDRERIYGLSEHVRGYGRDYKEILARAGFNVKVDNIYPDLDSGMAKYMGFPDMEEIYFVEK